MLLRYLAILLLVILVLRLVARLARRFMAPTERHGERHGERPGQRPFERARPGMPRQPIKQLSQCPTCGTYFEPERGLPQRTGDASPVCSEACLEAGKRRDPEEARERGA